MKAFSRDTYGGPEVLQWKEIEKPILKDDHILVKVCANSANPADWHLLRGEPFFARFVTGLLKPKQNVPGADFAGIVVEAGKLVKRFKPGDHVFGECLMGGAFAEYAAAPESSCAAIPPGHGFPETASLPIAGLTALQALITHGQLKAGETVLINGASGGVGHFAVQIAKAHGATVTAVCSSKNVEFVQSLGADAVIAYDQENIHQHKGNYDLVVDINGNLFHEDYKRMGRRGVMVGFTTMKHMFSLLIKKAFDKFPLVQFTAEPIPADLETLASLLRQGKLKPRIDKSYSYREIPAAIAYIEAMRTKGKVVMVWGED